MLLHLSVIKRACQCVLLLFSAGLIDCMSHSLQKIKCCCDYSQAVRLANKFATKLHPMKVGIVGQKYIHSHLIN